ncbi:hypothetical protein O0I10_008881 [Lichtheimia ornata]|uniref:Cyclin-like domain-containing protein n=1 Tax=Lichtheimia ornata TaxID=688661 RepID=A0AAD7UXB5_9FUNG|nr:uncharacterized protein O0I10_008881 [Lichtheimia ornata]KAJ8655389.1 hypothetical protein O0I10_008881 [Lichtheimia ornata]
MLLGPASSTTPTSRGMPPGFLDFASSSFDAIFYERLPEDSARPGEKPPPSRKRASHLPDLLPFIKLVTEKCKVQPVLLVMALLYVQRFRKALPPDYKAEPQAAHRIFAASLLLASKYSEDDHLSTRQLVRATGDVWSAKEMTRMELAFLRFLQWDLHIEMDEMESFLCHLDFDIALILPSKSRHAASCP